MRELVDGLTGASLDASSEPVDGPGWPPPRSFPVRECLLVVLNEEWEHRLYAERDLAVLEARQREDDDGRPYRLERFAQAQDAGGAYQRAVAELRAGRKVSHWIGLSSRRSRASGSARCHSRRHLGAQRARRT